MSKFSLSEKIELMVGGEFCGIPLSDNTLPIIKEFFESKGALVSINVNGGLNIARNWYLTVMLRNLEFDERELRDLVDRETPKSEETVDNNPNRYKDSVMSFMYSAKKHAADSVTSSIVSARENPKSALMALTVATAALGIGCLAFSRYKLK